MSDTTQNKQERYTLTITKSNGKVDIKSTDSRFTMDDLGLGDNYKPLDAYFKKADGEIIRRRYFSGENKMSNQILPRIAFQIYEKQIIDLPENEKREFPICKYNPNFNTICGIYHSVEEYREVKKSFEYLRYKYGKENKDLFVIYSWNIFSTLVFVKECLSRFGEDGDSFVLIYREKEAEEKKEKNGGTEENSKKIEQEFKGYMNLYSQKLIESKNIIFRGAPGTGKTYLAKEIAADIVSNGYYNKYTLLTDEQKQQIEFVQFHPSYDYSDFVEGLRPKTNEDGTMGFTLQDGIFKKFVERARKNYENSQKPVEVIEKELSTQEAMEEFFSNIEFGQTAFKTVNGTIFYITDLDDEHIYISMPENATSKNLTLSIDEIRTMLESGEKFSKVKDITNFFGKRFATQNYSYDFVLYNQILKRKAKKLKTVVKQEELKKFIFIIDEINRGEISKIFGELFFAIDPGYRGRAGEVSTQYSNLHTNPNDKFYIPQNVYIIGTMNDIDRSVDSFDFAMRRRFRFLEIKADARLEMLEDLVVDSDETLKDEAIRRMTALNNAIVEVEDLNENYQIGASYFLKLKDINFDTLWTDYLRPLLQEYIQGMYDEDGIMKKFAKAYGYDGSHEGNENEIA